MGREATEAALLAQRDDLAMIGIGCTAKQHGEKVWFIHPEGRFRKVWDFCQSFLLLYVAIMVPLRMGFDMEAEIGDGDWWVELFVDMYFISDIVFNFRTGVYDSDGVLITDRAKIRRKYLVRRLCPLRHATRAVLFADSAPVRTERLVWDRHCLLLPGGLHRPDGCCAVQRPRNVQRQHQEPQGCALRPAHARHSVARLTPRPLCRSHPHPQAAPAG